MGPLISGKKPPRASSSVARHHEHEQRNPNPLPCTSSSLWTSGSMDDPDGSSILGIEQRIATGLSLTRDETLNLRKQYIP